MSAINSLLWWLHKSAISGSGATAATVRSIHGNLHKCRHFGPCFLAKGATHFHVLVTNAMRVLAKVRSNKQTIKETSTYRKFTRILLNTYPTWSRFLNVLFWRKWNSRARVVVPPCRQSGGSIVPRRVAILRRLVAHTLFFTPPRERVKSLSSVVRAHRAMLPRHSQSCN